MAEVEPQAVVYEAPHDVPTEQEGIAEQPLDDVDDVLEQAVERAVEEDIEEAAEEMEELEPVQVDEEPVEEPAHVTIMEEPAYTEREEEVEENDQEPAYETIAEETTHETISGGPAHETIIEEAEEVRVEAIAEIDNVQEQANDDTTSVEQQPTIIITQATVPELLEETSVTAQSITTGAAASSSSSSTATTVTVIRDGQSTTTTEPFAQRGRQVTFQKTPKPRVIDRGRNRLIRDPILRALLGRRIAGAVGPEIRMMLEEDAGKCVASGMTAAAA